MHDLSGPDDTEPARPGAPGPAARSLSVTGRVQGVFFRRSLQEVARGLGVVGWVANRDDGSVEAWLEGAAEDVDEVVRWVAAGGPPQATVDAVVTEDQIAPRGHHGFEVR